MPSTKLLITRLKNDFPEINFQKSTRFAWSFKEKTIYYDYNCSNFEFLLLHELSHALLGHSEYTQDIELIAMERHAWDNARQIANKYDVEIDEDFIQSNLDSYREWIHKRSLCPKCNSNGLQIKNEHYQCPACNNKWKVNQAKDKALRRYELK